MNRLCGSRTVLTGSPGTIALTDPSDWVHMRIKTLPPFKVLSLSFLPTLLLPTVSLTLTFSYTPSPYSFSFLCLFSAHCPPFTPLHSISLPLSFRVSPELSPSQNVFFLSFSIGRCLYCWLDQSPKTSACLCCSGSICHQGVHCHSNVPLPSGPELETLKCVSSILLFLKANIQLESFLLCQFPNSLLWKVTEVGYHHLVTVVATAVCGVTGFMTELCAPCWSCSHAFFIEFD